MLGVWFIICVIFLTVFRYIWKRKENNPCMLFSYFLYLYDVTGLFYYVLVGKCRVKILYLLIVLFMVILQIGLPFLFNHIGRDNRVIKVLKNWHEQVMSSFMFWGMLILLYLPNGEWGISGGFFIMSYLVNAFFMVMKKLRESIWEMRMLQNIAGFFAFIICMIVARSDDFQYFSNWLFALLLIIWLVLLCLFTFGAVDKNPGMLYWLFTETAENRKVQVVRYKRIIKRFFNIFLSLFLLMFWVFIENTLEFYYTNRKTLEFNLSDFWGSMIVQSFFLSVIISVLVSLLKTNVTKIISCCLWGLAVASYIQVMIFDRDLGITDAYAIKWSDYSGKMIMTGIVWGICIVVPVILFAKFKNKFFSILKYVAVCLLCIQISATVYLVIKSGGYRNTSEAEITNYYVSGKNEYTVSEEKNIFVFVLDTYSNDFIDEMTEQYPDALEPLHDFTYYDNYDSKYDGTALAMNYLLTGQEFDNTIPCREYSKEAFHSEKAVEFYNTLKEQQYSCNIYTDKATVSFLNAKNLYEYYDNVQENADGEILVDYHAVRKNIIKGAMYKVLPLALKRFSLVVTSDFDGAVSSSGGGEDSPDLDDDFYLKLQTQGLEYNSSSGTFAIYHFSGMHDYGDGKGKNLPEAAYDNLNDVYVFLDELKNMGVYDNSTIIITADHGKIMTVDGIQPIFFIKEPYKKNDRLAVCSSPVSAEEFMPTIMKLITGESKDKTIYDYEADENRSRSVYIRQYKENISDLLKNDSANYACLYKYTYQGDKDELRKYAGAKPKQKIPLIDFWY